MKIVYIVKAEDIRTGVITNVVAFNDESMAEKYVNHLGTINTGKTYFIEELEYFKKKKTVEDEKL